MNGDCVAAGVIHACFIHCVNCRCRDVGLTGLGGSLWLRLLWMLPISVCELERERPSKYGLKDKKQRGGSENPVGQVTLYTTVQ